MNSSLKPAFLLVVLLQAMTPGFLRGQATAPQADATPPPAAPALLGEAELEKLVSPIALYPDPLIAFILPASAYPLEVVQLARFIKDTNNIPKVPSQPWDENVKGLAKFPEVVKKMDADLDWTTQLGEAFVNQDKDVMDMIQKLRGKVQASGALQSTPQQVVTVTNTVVQKTVENQVVYVTNQIVQIQPSNPEVIYVPSYPPTIYYPPPAYVYNPVAPLITFGAGVAMGAIIANNCDWYGGGIYGGHYHSDVDIDIDNNININNQNIKNKNVNRQGGQSGQKWQPDQARREKSATASTANSAARGWNQGSTRPQASTAGATRSGAGGAAASPTRPSATAGSAGVGQAAARPAAQSSSRMDAAPSRPAASSPQPSARQSTPSQSAGANRSAFNGTANGAATQQFSNRGAASRGGGGGAPARSMGGGGRGGGGRR